VSLVIFDLDNTLLGGDSDFLWGRFLVERGIVDQTAYEEANARFYEDYRKGTLDIRDFLNFALQPLAANEPETLYRWRDEFIEEKIKPIMLPPARALIAKHREAGDTLLVITATNRFVTEPIVRLFEIEHLLATSPEMVDGRYTGRFAGIPCFQEGKVEQLESWLKKANQSLEGSWFYSDSHNDLPLLMRVDHPVAVDPDETLERQAKEHGWPIISLRKTTCPDHHLATA
jgi:HAD superfamily hydrolase (TIGR01490 family)